MDVRQTFCAEYLRRPPACCDQTYRRKADAECTDPYKTAYIVVALRLIPTVLARTASGPCTSTNTTQKNAVTNVLHASDPRRPSGVSTRYAPS